MSSNRDNKCPDFATLLRETEPDQSLIEQVAHCFHRQLSNFALARCRDNELAQDSLQETMLTMMTSLGGYRGEAPLEAWLKKIVISSCARVRRGKINDPNLHYSMEESLLDNGDQNQEESLILGEQGERLHEALDKLEGVNRELLFRHEGMDESIRQLAEHFNLSEDAVKSRLKRSRAQVREKLLSSNS